MSNTQMTRRRLLRAGTAAGAFGLSGASLLTAGARAVVPANSDVLTASHWGAFRAKVVDGHVSAVRPWAQDPKPNAMLEGLLDSVYSPTRIKYPMVRRAYLERGPGADPEGRGDGDFVRVSWDQALDLVAKEIVRVEKTYGPAATFAGSYGWKSPGKLHNCQTLLRRMMKLKGGFVNIVGSYSTAAVGVIMPYVVGQAETDSQPTVWPVLAESTELMVFWGADPMNNCQIGWVIPDHGAYVGMEALKKKGVKVISIDPVRTETCTYLNAEWLAPRPQTDVAMMLGIANTLYAEKLHDTKFLADYTTGFDKFLPYLNGVSDGVPKTAEWAASICEIPAETIRDLARRFAKNRTMIAAGWSIQRQHHGEQAHWMLVTLASMLGQIGLPGGGYGLSYHYANGGSPAANSPVLTGITDGKPSHWPAWPPGSGAPIIPCARVVAMLENPGKPFDFNGTAYDDCPPHPTWMEPVERLGGPTTKFPLHIDTSHPKYRLHSQLCGTSQRATYTIAGREPCLINPKDATSRGIHDGDLVRVFNDRGQILAGARITEEIRPGVIRVNEGGWYDPANAREPGSLCRYGDVNTLTIDIGTSKLAQGNCGHTAVGDVEKYVGVPPEVGVFRAPGVTA